MARNNTTARNDTTAPHNATARNDTTAPQDGTAEMQDSTHRTQQHKTQYADHGKRETTDWLKSITREAEMGGQEKRGGGHGAHKWQAVVIYKHPSGRIYLASLLIALRPLIATLLPPCMVVTLLPPCMLETKNATFKM